MGPVNIAVALFSTAAFLFLNPLIYTWGFRARATPQEDGLATEFKHVSHELVQRTVVANRDRKTVQEALDKEVVGKKVRISWDQLKTVSPKAVTETAVPGAGKLVTFEKTGGISLKEAFQFMQFYPILYGEETHPTEFHVPIGKKIHKFKLSSKPDGTFSLKAIRTDGTEVDLSNLQTAVNVLSDSNLKAPLRDTVKEVSLQALDAKLNNQPDFESTLTLKDTAKTVTTKEREDTFRASTDVLAGTSIQKNKLTGLDPSGWLQTTNRDIGTKMEEVRDDLSKEIATAGETQLTLEFTQSMLKTSQQAIDE